MNTQLVSRALRVALTAGFALSAFAGTTLAQMSTEDNLNESAAYVQKKYDDLGIPKTHKLSLKIIGDWWNEIKSDDPRRKRGHIIISGNLARNFEENGVDTTMLVMCHEIGHFFGGHPAYKRNQGRGAMANEGNSDYYAIHACSNLLWKDQLEENAKSRALVEPKSKAFCDGLNPSGVEAQNLCYRQMRAAKALAFYLNREKPVHVDQPSTVVKKITMDKHPEGQCRLDTMMAAIACRGYDRWDHYLIPIDEQEMAATSCTGEYSDDPADNIRRGLRPRCWYAPPVGFN